MEVTKITMGKTIKIPGVVDRALDLAKLPQIPADDKGKAILVEKDLVKGNPAKEHYSLICADIDMLVNLRAQVIEAVDQFFHSFSFKKLATINIEGFKKLSTINIEELSRKEEQILIWGETEITHVALSRKRYILLKYREVLVRKFFESWKNNFVPGQGSSAVDLKVIDLLSDLHLFVLEELREQSLAHGLKWTRTCCSKIVEGSPRDRGAIIARTNTNTPSTCWLRTMIRVDGVWVVEPFCDQWVKIPRPMLDEPSSSDSSSDDVLMDFADQDTAAAANSLPAATTPDVTNALNQLRVSIYQIRERDDDGAKTKLQSSHKQLGTQIVTTGLDVVDIRRVVKETHQELNAKISSLDEQVAATRNDLLEFSAQAQQSLNVITTQLSELVAYINRGGDNKKGEVAAAVALYLLPFIKVKELVMLEGTGDAVRLTEPTQADIENANRAILERIRNEDSLRAERERDRARRERRLSRIGAYKRRRGY
ncbi:hypothetical protein F511_41563 [Dorcoceras hygrometricum]|uniref:Uncharacterized protein n=1 Tax=Dorcoceras hygrometricum TaxID=472368 RepID=A0A2Z7CV88_9LAMI|nr:hypothetical protein F511_41563 [Dorcoceras hygrometricum]